MATLQLPYFGEIATDFADEYLEVTVPLYDTEINLDINFGDSITLAHLQQTNTFLQQLDHHYKQVRHYLNANYYSQEDDTVRSYLDHHKNILDEASIEALESGDSTAIAGVLQQLLPVRIGFYPGEDVFATFDFSLNQDETDYLVVVNVTADGELAYMTVES